MPLTTEQRDVVVKIRDGSCNIVVNAVAGSGKTTTLIHASREAPDKKMLLLTFSSTLKTETRQRIKSLNIRNMTVDSFHSFPIRNWGVPKCHNDQHLRDAITSISKTNLVRTRYDVIMVDEIQDLKPLFYDLVMTIIRTNKRGVRLCIVGDKRQGIFEFMGSTPKYMLDPSAHFQGEWCEMHLSRTFRLTRQTVSFVDDAVLGNETMCSSRDGMKPVYLHVTFTLPGITRIYEHIKGFAPSDVMVLAPKVHSNKAGKFTPIHMLENLMVRKKWSVNVSTGDDTNMSDARVRSNKACFMTFHQAKGLERPCVVVFTFSEDYFQYFAREAPRDTCPNAMYVAITRASQKLVLVHIKDSKNPKPRFGFVNSAKMLLTCDADKGITPFRSLGTYKQRWPMNVTDIVKYLDTEATDEISKLLCFTVTKLKSPPPPFPPPDVVAGKRKGLHEYVASINGIVMPMYYQKVVREGQAIDCLAEFIRSVVRQRTDESGFRFLYKQLSAYDWIDDTHITHYTAMMDELGLSENATFEYGVESSHLVGRIDCLDNGRVLEFKHVGDVTVEMMTQTVLYGSMLHGGEETVLVNLKDGTLYNINCSDPEQLLRILISRRE